jgi:CubicO group peptidase (beta-lactamase class C family)
MRWPRCWRRAGQPVVDAITPAPPVGDIGEELDSRLVDVVESAIERFAVPGIAVGLYAEGTLRLGGIGATSVENPLPVHADTVFVAGSLTKPVVATAVMSLVGSGRLDLDIPVLRYLPDLRLADPSATAKVTLRHLMTHTAGWVGDDFEGIDYGSGDDALARAIASFGDRPQVFPVGSLWSYNNSGFWLAGRVVEVVTGKTLESAISELVLEPLEMTSSFFSAGDAITHRVSVGHNVVGPGVWKVARPWSVPRAQRAAGGLLTTIRDLMRFACRQLLGQPATGTAGPLTDQAAAMHEPLVPAEGSRFAGIGWVVREIAAHRVVSHAGDWNGQQGLVTVVPNAGVAVTTLANSDLGRRANDEIATWALQRYIGAADVEPLPVDGEARVLTALSGRYRLPGKSLEIRPRGRRLVIEYTLTSGADAPDVTFGQEASLTSDGRVLVLDGPFAGIAGDFAIGGENKAEWVRLGGRVHPRERD